MINIQIDKTMCRCEHSGDPIRVAAEVAASIGAIYNGYKCADIKLAEAFRMTFATMLLPDSGVWTPGEGDLTTMVIPKDTKKGGA